MGALVGARVMFGVVMGYDALMQSAEQTLDQFYPEMRWRILSLAADMDRIERAPGGEALMQSDARLEELRLAMAIVLSETQGRAERVQQQLSDHTPPPSR